MTRPQLAKIRKFAIAEMQKSVDPQHNFPHVDRVRRNALRIAKILNFDGVIDRNLLSAICYLHDLAFTVHRPSLSTWFLEGHLVKKQLLRLSLFELLGVLPEEQHIIVIAIIHHPLGFPLQKLNRQRDVYTQILQDADTLDFFTAERLTAFTVSRQLFLFYRVCALFSGFSHRLYRRNIHRYLNFPELAKHFL